MLMVNSGFKIPAREEKEVKYKFILTMNIVADSENWSANVEDVLRIYSLSVYALIKNK